MPGIPERDAPATACGGTPNTVHLVNPGTGQEEGGEQNARATGGPGILAGASNEKESAMATGLGGTPQPRWITWCVFVVPIAQPGFNAAWHRAIPAAGG